LTRRWGQLKGYMDDKNCVSKDKGDVDAFHSQFDPRAIELCTKWYCQLHEPQMQGRQRRMCSRDVVTGFSFEAVDSVSDIS
jgi:hypothetical protein